MRCSPLCPSISISTMSMDVVDSKARLPQHLEVKIHGKSLRSSAKSIENPPNPFKNSAKPGVFDGLGPEPILHEDPRDTLAGQVRFPPDVVLQHAGAHHIIASGSDPRSRFTPVPIM